MRGRNPIVIHYVHDMDRAKNFYTRAFDVKPTFESPGWTTLDFGTIEVALHILHPQSSEPERPLPHAGLNLEVHPLFDACLLSEADYRNGHSGRWCSVVGDRVSGTSRTGRNTRGNGMEPGPDRPLR